MKHLGFSLTTPIGLLIILCAFAQLLGTDPWVVARNFALCVPIVAYVIFTHQIMIRTMNVGEAGVQREVNGQGRRYVWHGVPVALCLMLAAAGTFIMVFAVHMQRLLGGAS